jgi:ferredoxin
LDQIILINNQNHFPAFNLLLHLRVNSRFFIRPMASDTLISDKLVSLQVLDRDGAWHTIEVPGDLGLNVMEACKASDLQMESICGGMGICGHCHVYVLTDQIFPPISDQEEETLDKLTFLKSNSRLSCQIHVDDRIDGMKIHLAPVE